MVLLLLGHGGYGKEVVVDGTHKRGWQGTDVSSMVVVDKGRQMSDKMRVVRERTWWEIERSVVEGRRIKGNRI